MSKINGSTQIKEGSINEQALNMGLVFNMSAASIKNKILSDFSGENLPIVPNADGTGYSFPELAGNDGQTIVSFNTSPEGIKTVEVYRWDGHNGVLVREAAITSTTGMLFYSKAAVNSDGTKISPTKPMVYIAHNNEYDNGKLTHYYSNNISRIVSEYHRVSGVSEGSTTGSSPKQYLRKATFTREMTSNNLPGTSAAMTLDRELPADAELSVGESIFLNGILQEDQHFKFQYAEGEGRLILEHGGPQLSDGDKITVVVGYLTSTPPVNLGPV